MEQATGRHPRAAALPVEWRILAGLGTLTLLYLFFRPLLTLALLFAAGLLLAAVLHPTVTWLEERARLPRAVPALLMVAVALGAGAALFIWVLPILLNQTVDLVQAVPDVYAETRDRVLALARRNPEWADYIRTQVQGLDVQGYAADLVAWLGRFSVALAGAAVSAVLVLVVALYSLMYPLPLVGGLLSLATGENGGRERVAQGVHSSLVKVRSWLLAQFAAMLVVGVLSAVALWLLGVPYALLFGLLAGLLEIVPTVGPILAALPPLAVAFAQEPLLALWVALAFLAIQQVENHLLIPVLMAGALRMHPVPLLFAVLAMGILFGLLGVLLAVPMVAVGQAFYQEFHGPAAHEERALAREAKAALAMEEERAPQESPPRGRTEG